MSKKAKQNDDRLLEVADELNKLLFANADDEGFIDVELETEDLKAAIITAAELLDKGEGDELTEESIETLQELFSEVEVKDKKVLKHLTEFGIIPEKEKSKKEEEPEETEQKEPDEDDLETQIENAEKISELKDIAKANDEFKKFRSNLNKYKTADDLREAMLEVLEDEDEPEPGKKPAPAPEEKTKKTTSKSGKTRANIMASILHESAKKPMTQETMVKKMQEKYLGSEAEAKFQVGVVIRYLKELGLITEKSNGALSYNE